MRETWEDILLHDPFYNPNLSLTGEGYEIAKAPRVKKPWLEA